MRSNKPINPFRWIAIKIVCIFISHCLTLKCNANGISISPNLFWWSERTSDVISVQSVKLNAHAIYRTKLFDQVVLKQQRQTQSIFDLATNAHLHTPDYIFCAESRSGPNEREKKTTTTISIINTSEETLIITCLCIIVKYLLPIFRDAWMWMFHCFCHAISSDNPIFKHKITGTISES